MIFGLRRPARGDAILLAALVLVVASVALATALSRPPSLDERADRLERELRCPTCQGLSIAGSPATAAAQMRALLREQLAAGASDAEVRAFFVARYGRWILLQPPLAGIDLAVWFAPALIVALGCVVVMRRARDQRSGGGPRWSARSTASASRVPSAVVVGVMIVAMAVPVASTVGPRLAGRQVSGGQVATGAVSLEDLERAASAQPDDVGTLIELGDALLEAGRPDDATVRYRRVLALDPDNIRALLGVGVILLEADRPLDAGPVFDRILALSPDEPEALLDRAIARMRLTGALTAEVRADVQRFLEVAPTDDPRRAMAEALLAGPGPTGESAEPSPSTP